MWIGGYLYSAKENCEQPDRENDSASLDRILGYQIQARWQNNCTVSITKDQSSKVCEHFSIF